MNLQIGMYDDAVVTRYFPYATSCVQGILLKFDHLFDSVGQLLTFREARLRLARQAGVEPDNKECYEVRTSDGSYFYLMFWDGTFTVALKASQFYRHRGPKVIQPRDDLPKIECWND